MILVRLMGGMGNQMFQYAAGRRLAHVHGVPLRLDLAPLRSAAKDAGDTPREYELHHFQISGKLATKEEVARFYGPAISLRGRLARKLRQSLRGPLAYSEREYDPQVLSLGSQVCLQGRFQSELYFSDIADVIRREFKVRQPLSKAASAILRDIESTQSVAIHVRRGDYITNQRYHDLIGPLPLEYYERALAEFKRSGASPKYFIFSDDMEWAEQNLVVPGDKTFVSLSTSQKAVEEFVLMSGCRHFVISNSSFAWWAAWLQDTPGKIVIAPKVWARFDRGECAWRLPSAWTRV